MSANPVLAADLRSLFTHPPLLRSLLAIVAGPGLILLAWWPRTTLAAAVLAANPPQTFTAVALGLLAVAAYLNYRYGAEDWAPPRTTSLRELASLTPMATSAILAGRTGSGLLHVGMQALVAAPLLIACRSVSGVVASAAAMALAVIASWALACRAFGTAARALLPAGGLARVSIAVAFAAGVLVVTFLFLPAVNPVSAIFAIVAMAPGAPRLPAVGPASLLGLGLAAGCTVGSWAVLHRVGASASQRHSVPTRDGKPGASSR